MGTFRLRPRTGEGEEAAGAGPGGWGAVRALTAGHELPLQLVPGQVEHPEHGVVQEDQQQREQEVPDEVEGFQDVGDLLPLGQEDGAWGRGAVRRVLPSSLTQQTPAPERLLP